MANVLKMTVVQSILSLHAQGWSHRRIAQALAINRRTVSRYVRHQQIADSKCTSAPIERVRLAADAKCTSAQIGSIAAAESAPSNAHVQAALNAGATREQILEAAGVAVMMQGGPTYTYLPRVMEALDALAERAKG